MRKTFISAAIAALTLAAAGGAGAGARATFTISGIFVTPDRLKQAGVESLAQEGMTMVVVTHELRFAHHVASSVLMMDEGRIVEEAPPEEFFSAPKQERTRRFLALVE